MDARGNPDQARALAHECVEDAGYGSVWAISAIRMVVLLIEFWLRRGIADPGDTPLAGEPTVDDMEDEG